MAGQSVGVACNLCPARRVLHQHVVDQTIAYNLTFGKENAMTVATMTSKGQITVPQSVRDALGLKAGAKVDFVPLEDGFKFVPLHHDITTLRGRFAGRVAKPLSLAQMDAAIAAGAAAGQGRR